MTKIKFVFFFSLFLSALSSQSETPNDAYSKYIDNFSQVWKEYLPKPIDPASNDCSYSTLILNQELQQVLSDIRNQASQWIIYADLDKINQINSYWSLACDLENFDVVLNGVNNQCDNCKKLVRFIQDLISLKQIEAFKGNYAEGIKISQKLLKLRDNLGNDLKLKIVRKSENQQGKEESNPIPTQFPKKKEDIKENLENVRGKTEDSSNSPQLEQKIQKNQTEQEIKENETRGEKMKIVQKVKTSQPAEQSSSSGSTRNDDYSKYWSGGGNGDYSQWTGGSNGGAEMGNSYQESAKLKNDEAKLKYTNQTKEEKEEQNNQWKKYLKKEYFEFKDQENENKEEEKGSLPKLFDEEWEDITEELYLNEYEEVTEDSYFFF